MIIKTRCVSLSLLFFCFGLLCVFSSTAVAANCLVNVATDINFGSGNAGDLRYCIGQSNINPGADVITFDIKGTILLNTSLPAITDSVEINGSDRAIVVDGQNHAGVVPFSVNGSSVTAAISDVTITRGNGNNPDSGGITVRGGATLELTCVTIDNCTTRAENGGGIFVTGSNLSIINSRIVNNHMSAPGSSGAGIYMQGGSFFMTGSVISNNTLPGSDDIGGAGIHFFQVSSARIENSTISGNINGNYGAGIHNDMSSLNMSNVTVNGNTGGVQAGGVSNIGGSLTLRNCTISGNSVTRYGGGIFNGGNGAVLTLANTIVAGNTAGFDAPDIFNFATMTRAGANIVQAAVVNSGTIGGTGTIVNADPRLLPLAANGGLVPTQGLATRSLARNAGTNSEALDTLGVPLLYDARGPGFPRVRRGFVDIGAFESIEVRTGFDSDEIFPKTDMVIPVSSNRLP